MKTEMGKAFTLLVAMALGVALTLWVTSPSAVHGQGKGGAAASPRYSVIDTEGHNLIVTDNSSNMLYFYTIDRDAEIGADLKLRGSLDLNNVGKDVLDTKGWDKKPDWL